MTLLDSIQADLLDMSNARNPPDVIPLTAVQYLALQMNVPLGNSPSKPQDYTLFGLPVRVIVDLDPITMLAYSQMGWQHIEVPP